MKKITEKECIEKMLNNFPSVLPYWNDFVKSFGEEEGLTFQMLPFGEYTVEVIESNNEKEIIRIFDFIEGLITQGNEYVQAAATTGYLEYLMTKDPDEIQFSKFVKYMGKESIAYCRAWDEFTGVRTKGLWDEATS